ncbi:MAG: indole-3-glycerol phosphate synthase TrpC [Acidobacteriota bacterium]|jgi:indole-3-glycerol phosphate synthase|nr:indole-3-glycerol phosphate synthase TrpC [Acidobacteriota bacterium]
MTEDNDVYQLPEALAGTVLEKIMAAKLPASAAAEIKVPLADLEASLGDAPAARPLRAALARAAGESPSGVAVIAEIKKASPSAGLIREDFRPLEIAASYAGAGAAALSVLTEEDFFRGGMDILSSVRAASPLPVLRKDFIVSAYQLVEARAAGADAALLIVALLGEARLAGLLEKAADLGLDALVEVHSEEELRTALRAGAKLVGVNSRDLRTFKVDLEVARRLARLMPGDVFPVAESGIKTAEDVRWLADAGYKGFLVGERLMRAPDPGAALRELTGDIPRSHR